MVHQCSLLTSCPWSITMTTLIIRMIIHSMVVWHGRTTIWQDHQRTRCLRSALNLTFLQQAILCTTILQVAMAECKSNHRSKVIQLIQTRSQWAFRVTMALRIQIKVQLANSVDYLERTVAKHILVTSSIKQEEQLVVTMASPRSALNSSTVRASLLSWSPTHVLRTKYRTSLRPWAAPSSQPCIHQHNQWEQTPSVE